MRSRKGISKHTFNDHNFTNRSEPNRRDQTHRNNCIGSEKLRELSEDV